MADPERITVELPEGTLKRIAGRCPADSGLTPETWLRGTALAVLQGMEMREGKGQWVLRIPVSQGFYGEMRKSLSTKALGRWLKQAVRAQWAARNPEALEGLPPE